MRRDFVHPGARATGCVHLFDFTEYATPHFVLSSVICDRIAIARRMRGRSHAATAYSSAHGAASVAGSRGSEPAWKTRVSAIDSRAAVTCLHCDPLVSDLSSGPPARRRRRGGAALGASARRLAEVVAAVLAPPRPAPLALAPRGPVNRAPYEQAAGDQRQRRNNGRGRREYAGEEGENERDGAAGDQENDPH